MTGFYFALADQIADRAERVHRIEDLWRAQEAKVLRVLGLCEIAEDNESGMLAQSLNTVCTLLETEPQLQSPMIMQAIDTIIKDAKIPALRERAAQCRLRTDWSVTEDDIKNYCHRASHDNWVTEDQEKAAHQSRAKITAAQHLLDNSGDGARRQNAVQTLKSFTADPALAQHVREIFAAAAANDASPARAEAAAALEEIPALQAQTAKTVAQELQAAPVIPRPYRLISK